MSAVCRAIRSTVKKLSTRRRPASPRRRRSPSSRASRMIARASSSGRPGGTSRPVRSASRTVMWPSDWGLGTFATLLDLTAGAWVDVADSRGGVHAYRVLERHQIAKADLRPVALHGHDDDHDDNVVVVAVPTDG